MTVFMNKEWLYAMTGYKSVSSRICYAKFKFAKAFVRVCVWVYVSCMRLVIIDGKSKRRYFTIGWKI